MTGNEPEKTATTKLNETDCRAIAAVMSETCHQKTRGAQIRTLMDGLCALVDAKAWVWGVSVRLSPDTLPTWILHRRGGFSSESYAQFLRAQEHPDLKEITAPFARLLFERNCHLTRLRQQTDPENRFANSDAKPLWDAAGVAPGIMSCRPLPGGEISVAGVFRSPEAPLFDERERKLAHILLSEVSWLHLPEKESLMEPARRLSPRRLTVYNLMLQGHSRAEIAAQLGVTPNTVNSYCKEVFRHFNVHSQAELMACLREDDQFAEAYGPSTF